MSEAFQCDRCDKLFAGKPHQTIGWGPTGDSARARADSGDGGNREVCEGCWQDFMRFMEGESP